MRDYLYLLPNLLVLLIFIGHYFSMPHLRNRRNGIFLQLLTLQTLVPTLDFISGGANADAITVPDNALFLLNLLYCVLLIARAYWQFEFAIDILRLKASDAPIRTWLCRSAFLVGEAVALSNPLTGAIFRIVDGRFLKGPLNFVPSACLFFYSVVSLVLLTAFSSDRLSRYERISAFCAQGSLLLGNLIYCFLPSHVVISAASLISIIILYLTFENPNLYIANRGNAFNMRAFREMLDEMIAKKNYRVLAFGLRDYIDMRGIYGGHQMDSGVSLIGAFLVKTFPEYQAFYLRSGRFALLGTLDMDWDQIREEIYRRFQAPWIADETELDLNIAFVKIEPGNGPDDVGGILNRVFLAFDNVENEIIHRDGLIDPKSLAEIDRQVEVKRCLERRLERNELEIFLQPLIDGKTRQLVGAEVLSRIRDDDGKLISPALFVPIAEKNGCINLMGEQALEKACQFVRDHDLNAIGLSWINVNLSPLQCMKKDLSERFSTILEQYGVSTEIIHLEITEQSVMDMSRLENQIRILRGIGFRFSLDDYGSGYSNLSRVKKYPFANIKLDMGIVWDYIRDRDALLPTIVKAFKEMGFSITAEGIETEEIADAMCAIGCDYLQGYYFSKPLPVEEFVEKYSTLKKGA